MKTYLCTILFAFALSFVAHAKIGEARAEVEAAMGGPGEITDDPLWGKLVRYHCKQGDNRSCWYFYRLGKVVAQGVPLSREDELPSMAKKLTGYDDVRESEDDAGLLALAGPQFST